MEKCDLTDFSSCVSELKFTDPEMDLESVNLNFITDVYQAACYDVINKLLKVLVGRDPVVDDMKRMQFLTHATDRTKTAVTWDDDYIGDMVPGLPQMCGYSFYQGTVFFTPKS